MFAEMLVIMKTDNRKTNKGFTLIELMVVIFIVGILSAIAIPIMRGRTDSAKWSEGKAIAGSIRTAIRAYFAEKGSAYANYVADLTGDITVFGAPLGFTANDLDGKYFVATDFAIGGVAVNGTNIDYTITVTAGGAAEAPVNPPVVTLNQAGTFTP
jgi:type IV pilus assembly protein PilA